MGGKIRILTGSACLALACVMLIGLTSCSSVTKAERRMKKKTDLDIDLSGCVIETETDTHAAMGDGEYLLVLSCVGNEPEILKQIRDWQSFPLSVSLQTVLYEREKLAERYGIPQIENGAWYFYDRHSEAAADRHSDEELLSFSRGAENFSLVMYDADNGRLYYFERDT